MTAPFFIGMLAETPLHPGTGQSTGVVDLPVSREKTTGWPQIPETGLKGALKQWAREPRNYPDVPAPTAEDPNRMVLSDAVKRLFGLADLEEARSSGGEEGAAGGPEEGAAGGPEKGERIGGAGEVLFTTGRLLLLPVRRLDGPYAWVTAPGLVERLARDMRRILGDLGDENCPAIDPPAPGSLRCGFHSNNSATEFLEEFPFGTLPLQRHDTEPEQNKDGRLIALLKKLMGENTQPAARLERQIAIMNDSDFAWYAANALPVNARNVLNDAKISQNLWYEETLPTDTLLYAALPPRGALNGDADRRYGDLKVKLAASPYLQIGGNETVGHGWVRVTTYPA
jgi:CRISPR-associated protein Cmr4